MWLGKDLPTLPPRIRSFLQTPRLGKDLTELPLAGKAFIATAILVLIGGIAAPSTVNSTAAILSTLPYFAILAVASIGQHLVIQQRGLDLSTAGIMSFAAVVVTKLPNGSTDPGVVLFWSSPHCRGRGIGAITGLIVTLLEVPPLVTTIGVNAILFGLTYFVSTGASVQSPLMMVDVFRRALSLCADARSGCCCWSPG